MLKPMLFPAILAILVGVAASTGFSVMQSRTTYTTSVMVQDAIARMKVDSMLNASAVNDTAASDSLSITGDSVSAIEAQNIVEQKEVIAESVAKEKPATPAKRVEKVSEKSTQNVEPDSAVSSALSVITPVIESASSVPHDVLPEKRLAKIFGSMSARDAAKVLDQMSDSDIRTILAMMGDRQAAAVLSALPASRAAAVTLGRTKPEKDSLP